MVSSPHVGGDKMYHIGFCGDEKYMQYIAVAMYSIVKNTNMAVSYKDKLPVSIVENQEGAEEKYCFHIITDCLSEATVHKLSLLEKELNVIFPCSIEIFYAQDEIFKNYPRWRGNYMTYYRLLYPQILPKEVKVFLYIDGDTLAVSDSREIFTEKLDSYTVGAVVSYRSTTKKLQKEILVPRKKGEKNYSFFTHKYYFCAGVMLINIEKWKKENVEEKFFGFLNTYHIQYPDQDALNYAFKDNFKVLDFKYDVYCAGMDKKVFSDAERQLKQYGVNLTPYEKPCILHYMQKPWNSGNYSFSGSVVFYNKYMPLWWEYAEKTPVYSAELMEYKQSETYAKIVQKCEKRKKRYEQYRYFYWIRKWVSLWKEQFLYWINSLR